MPLTSPSNSQAFTLVEVMMAMLIMTVGLLGLLQSVGVAYEHNIRNRLREEAVLIAEEKMNDLRNNGGFNPVTTVTRVIGGVGKVFVVNKESLQMGTDSYRLKVAVRWTFKNVTALKHEIYTVKNR